MSERYQIDTPQKSLKEYKEEELKQWKEFEASVIARYEEGRKQALKKHRELLEKQEERKNPKFVKKHYHQIDNAMKREEEIREKTKKECDSFESAEMQKLKKKKTSLFVVWLAVIISLSTIVLFALSFKMALILLSVLLAIVSFVAVRISTSFTDKHKGLVQYVRETKETEAKWEISSVYYRLLNGVVIPTFLGIPDDISFVDGQPSDATENSIHPRPYGTFNRYVSLNYGKCFHVVEGCSGARFPINALELSYNDYKIGYRHYAQCAVCVKSWNSAIVVPEWYPYYVKVKTIADKYEIKVFYDEMTAKQSKEKDLANWKKNIMI